MYIGLHTYTGIDVENADMHRNIYNTHTHVSMWKLQMYVYAPMCGSYACVYTEYVDMCICNGICICTCTHTHIIYVENADVRVVYAPKCVCVYLHTYTYIYIEHADTCVCTDICVCTYIHTYTYVNVCQIYMYLYKHIICILGR